MIYKGLIPYIEKFCEEREYRLRDQVQELEDEVSLLEIVEFLKEIKIPVKPREYQVKNIAHCIRKKRATILSPTGSGKSLSIYSLIRWYGTKTLLIVPTTGLVQQMFSDFMDYSKNDDDWNVALNCSKFMGGSSKENLNQVVIGTWQSIINQDPEWLEQFEFVIVDEAHGAKAKSLIQIMETSINAKYRFGFTGTLDGTNVNKLVLEGLFGLVESVVDTKELMDQGYLSKLKIQCLILNFDPITSKKVPRIYQKEIQYLIENEKRNNFISNLACSLKGNTLILYLYVEKHGEILDAMIRGKTNDDKQVFYIHGGVKSEVREQYRQQIEANNNSIIIASYGTFSQGVNITNINNIIFASPSKSRIRNLQSIGRGLRLNSEKEFCTLFDISDDMSHGSYKNYSLKHFFERIRIYNEQRFDYKIHKIKIQ